MRSRRERLDVLIAKLEVMAMIFNMQVRYWIENEKPSFERIWWEVELIDLASMLRLPERTLRRYIRQLVISGLLEHQRKSKRLPNAYRVTRVNMVAFAIIVGQRVEMLFWQRDDGFVDFSIATKNRLTGRS